MFNTHVDTFWGSIAFGYSWAMVKFVVISGGATSSKVVVSFFLNRSKGQQFPTHCLTCSKVLTVYRNMLHVCLDILCLPFFM